MVKKILGISCAVLITLLWVKTVDAKEYPWPTGKSLPMIVLRMEVVI